VLNVTDEPTDEPDAEKLKDLDQRLKAIEARKQKSVDHGAEVGANKGMQALGELVGGILAGLGLGWVTDTYLLHTKPWGMIVGTLLGMVAAVYTVVKSGQNRRS